VGKSVGKRVKKMVLKIIKFLAFVSEEKGSPKGKNVAKRASYRREDPLSSRAITGAGIANPRRCQGL
jgi:hypothetical protein